MNGWVLFAWLLFVWLLALVEAACRKAIEDVRHPLPNQQRRSEEIFPVIPIVPLVFLGIAKLIDIAAVPWGTWVIFWLHAIMAVGVVIAIVHDVQILRKSGFFSRKTPGSTPDVPPD